MSDSEENNVMSFFLIERHRREVEELHRALENFHLGREELVNELLSEILSVQPITVPPDFWDPVKVTLSDEDKKFKFTDETWECFICREERTKKTEMECCKQSLCDSCVENWFNKESVKCPFCKKDIREN